MLFIFACTVLYFSIDTVFEKGAKDKITIVNKKINSTARKILPMASTLKKIDYLKKIRDIKKFSYYYDLLTREIFIPFVVKPKKKKGYTNPYILKRIIKKECPLVWKGLIVSKDSKKMFAQVNVGNDTFFVKKGGVSG